MRPVDFRAILNLDDDAKVDISPIVPTMASPSWWGADSQRYIISQDNSARQFMKVMDEHTRAYIDWDAAFDAAMVAGRLGIGPKVNAVDVMTGILIMEDLTDSASTATVDCFEDEAIEPLIDIRKSVFDFPVMTKTRIVFDELSRLHQEVAQVGGILPKDINWMFRKLDAPAQRIKSAGYDLVPAHGDGNVSNVAVMHDGKGLRLLDWDSAGMMDPFQDLGVLLHELRPFDLEARAAFEAFWGSWDSSLFDRCRIYGIADCVRWGLIGVYADAVNPGVHEYSKFADWQFLRARDGLNSSQYSDRVRNL